MYGIHHSMVSYRFGDYVDIEFPISNSTWDWEPFHENRDSICQLFYCNWVKCTKTKSFLIREMEADSEGRFTNNYIHDYIKDEKYPEGLEEPNEECHLNIRQMMTWPYLLLAWSGLYKDVNVYLRSYCFTGMYTMQGKENICVVHYSKLFTTTFFSWELRPVSTVSQCNNRKLLVPLTHVLATNICNHEVPVMGPPDSWAMQFCTIVCIACFAQP